MPKAKAKGKKESKPKVAVSLPPKKEVKKPVATPKIDLQAIKKERDELIAGIQPNLLTNSQLNSGGSVIRTKYMKEMGLNNIISEINRLGRQIGQMPIGLGHLRKE